MTQFTITANDEDFEFLNPNDEFADKAGVYLFCKELRDRRPKRYLPLYVGQTKSLKQRLVETHFKWSPAITLGMTHILIDYEDNDNKRLEREGFYLGFFDPELNG